MIQSTWGRISVVQAADGARPAWNRLGILVCPTCRSSLSEGGGGLVCEAGHAFPLAGDRPVLIGEGSAFAPEDVASATDTYFSHRVAESTRRSSFRRSLPPLGTNVRGRFFEGAQRIVTEIARERTPVGLLLGCGERGAERTKRFPEADWLLTDVDLNYSAEAAADVTDLPIADASVDIVLVEHVLEHVLDPVRAAQEIERVLRPGGVVVAIIPFSFPWHGIPTDYFRVTPSGIRVLFRSCEVVYLGAGSGGGSTVAYGLNSTITGMPRSTRARRIAYVVSRVLLSPLRYLDRLEPRDGRGLGFAGEMQFIGRKVVYVLTDREVYAEVRELFD